MAEPVAGEKPKIMSLYFPGGAMAGIHPLAVLARIEELTGKPISDLFQNMEGGSAAAFLIAGMNTRKSNNPDSPDYDKPRYTMKEGLKLFIDTTPGAFPDIPQRLPKMLMGQYYDMKVEEISTPPKKIIECQTEGFLAKLCNGFNVAAAGAQMADKALTATLLGAPSPFIRKHWAKDYMYDPDKLADLYKKVLGEDTKLSDVRGTIRLPVYNMTAQEVQYFTVEKNDLLNAASGNAKVSHGDPKLWEVAMAATANNLAYKPYIMGNHVYFDGAMFQKPTTHLDLVKRKDSPEIVLVDLALASPDKGSIPDAMQDSKIFNGLVDVMHKDMKAAKTPEDLKRISEVYGSAVHGFTEGGLTAVRNYVAHTTKRNDERNAFEQTDGNVIRIAPPALKPNENPKSVPGFLDAFTATPENIGKYLDYSKRTLGDQDGKIRELSVELLANQVRLGRMSLEEFREATDRIKSNDFEHSEIPAYLDSLKTDAPALVPGRSAEPVSRAGISG
jgi:patatin-like phospholipase/acyl hydrolase